MLDHAHRNCFLLVVAHLDLETLVRPPIRILLLLHLVVGLLALARDIESVARIDADGFVLGRVVNLVLAGEFELPVLIAAVETHAALGQRHPQVVRFGVDELAHHPHVRIGIGAVLRHLAHIVAILILIARHAIVNIEPFGCNSTPAQELHLLGLAVMQRGGKRQVVQMVVFERSLGHLGFRHESADDEATLRGGRIWRRRAHLVHIAGHQLDPRVIELLTALVIERHPADQIERVARLRRHHVVIGVPGHAAGHVAQLGIELRRHAGVDDPIECRLEDRIVAQRRKDGFPGQRELQLAVDLDDRLAIARTGRCLVVRHVPAAHDFAGHNARGTVLQVDHEVNRLAFVKIQQQFLRNGIGAIVLLQNHQGALAGGVAQNHRIGLQARGGAGKAHRVGAGVQVQRQSFADHSEVLVIDSEGGVCRHGDKCEAGAQRQGVDSGSQQRWNDHSGVLWQLGHQTTDSGSGPGRKHQAWGGKSLSLRWTSAAVWNMAPNSSPSLSVACLANMPTSPETPAIP